MALVAEGALVGFARDMRPEWALRARAICIWGENYADVSCPGHEGFYAAYRRIFGRPFGDEVVLDLHRDQEETYYLIDWHLFRVVVVASYPGNSEIRAFTNLSPTFHWPRIVTHRKK